MDGRNGFAGDPRAEVWRPLLYMNSLRRKCDVIGSEE